MIKLIRNWFNNRIIKRSTITQAEWNQALASLPLLVAYTTDEKHTLKNLAILFLHRKIFEGAHGLVVSQEMTLIIALQACIPILKMDINAYDGWVSIIVYPVGFSPKREVMDEFGVQSGPRLTALTWVAYKVTIKNMPNDFMGNIIIFVFSPNSILRIRV